MKLLSPQPKYSNHSIIIRKQIVFVIFILTRDELNACFV